MEKLEINKKVEQRMESHENSKLFAVALTKYHEFESGKLTKKDLDTWLMSEEGFGQEDKDSFNCDTFILMVMKHQLGMTQIEDYADIQIDAYQWMDEKGEMDDELKSYYLEHVNEEFPDDKELRMKKRAIFLNNIRKDSLKFEIDKFKDKEKDLWPWDMLPGEFIQRFKKTKISRFVFVNEDYQLDNEDLEHAFIILGLNRAGDDLVVLEKSGPGYHLDISTLSRVLKRLNYYIYKGVLYIPEKAISTYYPD